MYKVIIIAQVCDVYCDRRKLTFELAKSSTEDEDEEDASSSSLLTPTLLAATGAREVERS